MSSSIEVPVEGVQGGFVQLVDQMGSDLTVCNAARVSFAKETDWEIDQEAADRLAASGSSAPVSELVKLSEKDQKLLKYLAEHGHWTPFAHPQMTFRIKAPISIRTQFFKHKQGFVENEISRRYVSFEPEFYYPKWRGKPTNGAKQGSEDFLSVAPNTQGLYDQSIRSAMYAYNTLLDEGVAPEQARFVLPQGMFTEWFWTGSLAAYMRFYNQRSEDHAQWEIRQYAKAILKVVEGYYPWSAKYLAKDS
ncbi:MAG: FAD-dependent thymidylate synthase [Candidatus Nanopelagicaceae bacterium]